MYVRAATRSVFASLKSHKFRSSFSDAHVSICSLTKHGLHNNLVSHLVAVNEELVFELLAQAEKANFCRGSAFLLHFRLVTRFQVQGLNLLDRA